MKKFIKPEIRNFKLNNAPFMLAASFTETKNGTITGEEVLAKENLWNNLDD